MTIIQYNFSVFFQGVIDVQATYARQRNHDTTDFTSI